VRDLTRACVHCGLCLESCPTYRVLREEADSPRGRILLLDALLEGRAEAADVRRHLDRCVGCLACAAVCPSGVPYGTMLEAGRRQLGGPSLLPRLFLKHVVNRPLLLRVLAGAARLLGAVPPKPPPIPWPTAPAKPKGRLAIHLGCVTPHLFPNLAAEAACVLARLGYAVEPAGRRCCGALHRHAGLPYEAPAIEALSLAAGCSTTPGLTDVCKVLLSERIEGARLPPVRVAWDAPCHLLHAQGVDAAALLDAIEGVERVTLPGAAECCGAGGLYMGLQPALARKVREKKVAEILASGAKVVATANPGCMLWIWRGLREAGAGVEVLHPVTLLARALPHGAAPGS
jgi:glycolate oxidase iron-sulfur subunit